MKLVFGERWALMVDLLLYVGPRLLVIGEVDESLRHGITRHQAAASCLALTN
jgi:hypothetical protein